MKIYKCDHCGETISPEILIRFRADADFHITQTFATTEFHFHPKCWSAVDKAIKSDQNETDRTPAE